MLVLCSTCSRHVKTTPCPFCGGESTASTRPSTTRRLSRAQLIAGAALVSVAAGCSSDEPTPDPDADAGLTSSSGGSTAPAYGAPADPFDGGDDDGGLSSSGGVAPAYGAPTDGGTI